MERSGNEAWIKRNKEPTSQPRPVKCHSRLSLMVVSCSYIRASQGLWGGFQVITTKCSGFYSLSLFYFSWLPLLFNWYFLLYLVLFSGILDSYSYIFRKSSFIIFFFLIYIWLLFLFRILEIQELSCAFRSFWWFYSSPFQTSQPLILL